MSIDGEARVTGDAEGFARGVRLFDFSPISGFLALGLTGEGSSLNF